MESVDDSNVGFQRLGSEPPQRFPEISTGSLFHGPLSICQVFFQIDAVSEEI